MHLAVLRSLRALTASVESGGASQQTTDVSAGQQKIRFACRVQDKEVKN